MSKLSIIPKIPSIFKDLIGRRSESSKHTTILEQDLPITPQKQLKNQTQLKLGVEKMSSEENVRFCFNHRIHSNF